MDSLLTFVSLFEACSLKDVEVMCWYISEMMVINLYRMGI
jgi:hypothetical protein